MTPRPAVNQQKNCVLHTRMVFITVITFTRITNNDKHLLFVQMTLTSRNVFCVVFAIKRLRKMCENLDTNATEWHELPSNSI